MTEDKIAQTVQFIVPFLQMATRITPTNIDDRVVAFLVPILTSPHFAPFMSEIMNQFQDKQPTLEDILSFVASKQGVAA